MSEGKTLYSTREAAEKIGTSDAYLRVILKRNPELSPARKLSEAWVWTDGDIERVRQWKDSKEQRAQSKQ